ncbi:autoinducer binding domain-containing protein [Paraburkholderia acidicola]|uniref:Autoinducer binding domain-containing protein n=1 Tax=Paraburkholderia acidicola TaxID=1912599 RepID=A0ABV1LTB3_9BURK
MKLDVWPESESDRRLVQTREVLVNDGRVALCLIDCEDNGLLLERVFIDRDGARTIQRLDAGNEIQLMAFLQSDPYIDLLRDSYNRVLTTIRSVGQPSVPVAALPAHVSECRDELEVLALMRSICASNGGMECLYRWITVGEQDMVIESHVILAHCHPAWTQSYVHNHWVLNDPAVDYARHETAPLRGSDIKPYRDEHWFAQKAGVYGLNSNVFFPAHRRRDPMFGLLHVSSHMPSPEGEDLIWQNRQNLRGLAAELLEWRVMQLRQTAAQQFPLSTPEVVALRVIRRGGSAAHVAHELSITEREAYRLFRQINVKMGCGHIRVSAGAAQTYGLLGSI